MALCSKRESPGGESRQNSHTQVQGKSRRALAQSLRLGIREMSRPDAHPRANWIDHGVSRERVRQIEAHALRNSGTPPV